MARVVREVFGVGFRERADFKDTYGGEEGHVFIECMRIRPESGDAKTAVVFSHPIGGGAFLPIMKALAVAGHHVVYVNTRYRGNDTALIMEKCLLDLGAAIAYVKERFGYERIVLGGWSGGGSLALFYQEQAEHPSVTITPAGDPVDVAGAELTPGDALFLVAAHVSRARTLTEWLDASIRDETNPSDRDATLDLYDPANPAQPPYGLDFLERYRRAQVARSRRITDWVEERLAEIRATARPHDELAFVVHGTMADPRWLDPAVDPNERAPGRCYLGDPRTVNMSPVGLARFCTLRSWLSQWSLERTQADGIKNAPNTGVPTLVVGNGADDACTPSHTERLYEAIPHDRKELHTIAGATHYYAGQPDELARCITRFGSWLDGLGLSDARPA